MPVPEVQWILRFLFSLTRKVNFPILLPVKSTESRQITNLIKRRNKMPDMDEMEEAKKLDGDFVTLDEFKK